MKKHSTATIFPSSIRLFSAVILSVVLSTQPAAALVSAAAEDDVTSGVQSIVEKTAQELGYGINVYECDKDLKKRRASSSSSSNHQGSNYRVCFEPNQKAIEDGVGIRSIDSFIWRLISTTTTSGTMVVDLSSSRSNSSSSSSSSSAGGDTANGGTIITEQVAVVNGHADEVLSTLVCGVGEHQQLCYLDTLLNANFYSKKNNKGGGGHVVGTGSATMTLGTGIVGLTTSAAGTDEAFLEKPASTPTPVVVATSTATTAAATTTTSSSTTTSSFSASATTVTTSSTPKTSNSGSIMLNAKTIKGTTNIEESGNKLGGI